MSKIRTREVKKGYIKTIDHAACMSEHVKNTAVKTRLQAEHDNGNEQNNASSYASNNVENAAKQVIGEGVRESENLTRSARQGIRNIGSRVDVKSKADMLRRSVGAIEETTQKNTTEFTAESQSKNIHIKQNTVASRTVSSKKVEKGRTIYGEVEKSRILSKKVESARKAGTLPPAKRGVRGAGKLALKSLEKAAQALIRAIRLAIESTKAMVMALSTGGIAAVAIIIICILFGAAFYVFGDESSSNYTPVSEEVEAYTDLIEKYAAKYDIPEYVDLIKAVMMQESGGRGTDPMQCSESPYNKKYSNKPGGIKDPEYSIDCGVHYLANCLKLAKCEGPLDMDRIRLAIQGYNYGNGYIGWAIERDGGYTVQNAAIFSRQQAKKHGWKSYGDKLYASHVLRYYPYGNYNYGIGNKEIIKVAAKEIGNVGGDKFWRWYGFNSHVGWCACFVSWCADQCGYVKAGIIPKYANCRDTLRWFQAKNQYQKVGYVPTAGDIIWFDWNGDGKADHIGLVEDSDGKQVHTIEGNSHNMCRRKTYGIRSGVILGYGIPKY